MKKLLLALTLVLCLAVSLVAFTSCGGTEEDGCEHIWATEATVDTAATCTQEGAESIKCTVCGEKKADSITAIPAYGHSYDEGTTVPATCTEDGSVTKTCAVCGDVNVTTIPAAGEHTWSTEPIIDTYPTCTTDGQKSIKCTACQVTKPDSTETIPAGHTWADSAAVIVPATCTTEGSMAIKCTVCREVKPDSTEVIPATGHTDIDVVVAPTLFTEGRIKGTCSTCGVAVNEAIDKADPTSVVTFSPDGENVGIYKNVNIVNDVLKGDHFYPTEENPDGKSLYIEFSILWNETLLDVYNGKARYAQLGTLGDMNGTSDGKRITPYFLVFNQTADKEKFWCQYPGGFETDNNTTNIYGPKVESNLPADGYTYIGDYGWHRIGIEYTQVTEIEGETVKYTLYATLYVDGVKKLAYQAIKTTTDNNPNLLYTATVVNGDVEYEDIASDRYAFIYRFGNDQKTETEDNAYFVVGDVSVTAGDGFAMPVTKLDTPTDGTYSPAEDVTLDADQYFAYEKSVNEMLYDETLDSVEYPVDMITPADGTVDYSVNSGGTKYHRYQAHDNKRVAFIKIKDIAFNTVNIGVADGATVRYTFFSKMPTEYNEVVSYAIQYRTFIDATADVSVEIPANAEYLVLYYQDNATTKYIPESLTFTNNPNTFSEQLKDDTIETLEYPIDELKPSQGTIASANLRYIPNFDWVATFIDIRGCAFDKVTFEVNAETGTFFYAFLTQFPDIYDYPEFAGEGNPPTGPEEGQPAGTKVTVDIPEDAVCMYVYWQDEGPIYYVPESITFTNSKYAPTVTVMGDSDIAVNDKYNIINDVLKGDHFYPTEENPNGKDLYVEMSMLWNPTLANVAYGYMEFGSCSKADFNGRMTPFYLNFRDNVGGQWCKFEGGFEPSSPASNGIYYGPSMPNGGSETDYPYIGEYGWHRVGVQVHQEAVIDGDSVVYKATATLYIDGVMVSSYDYNLKKVSDDLLFKAEIVDGELVYSDNTDATYVVAYRIANGKSPDAPAYFVVDDVYVTCGTGFVMPVEKLDTPIEGTFSPADGVELDADVYFAPATDAGEDSDDSEDAGTTTPDEPVDDGTYSYPINTITPVEGFFNRQGRENDNKTCTYKASTSGENVAFIDISELDYNTVTFLGNANNESGWYTFLTKMPTADGEKISYAMNYNKAIWFGLPDGPITVTIPDNAKYIAILYNYENDTPTYPQSIVFSNNENTPSENLKNDELDSYEYPMEEIKPSMGTIADDGNKFIQNYWWVGSYVGIEDCVFDKVVIEIGESGEFYYAFLTAYPELDKAVSFAGGATATIKVVGDAGTKVTIDIPDDAVCFYIYRHGWNETDKAPIYCIPESITFIKADDATDSEDAGTTTPGGSTDSEDAENAGTTTPGGSTDSEDAENAGTTTPGGSTDSEDAENAGNGGASEDAENAGNSGASDSEDAETTTPIFGTNTRQ